MGKFAAILAYIIFTTMFLTMAASVNAQDKPSKEITFTLSGTYSIGEIFDQIHSQTGIYVSFEHSFIDVKKKVTIHFRNTTIREVMDKVLGDLPVDWMFSGGDIALFENKTPERKKEDEPITILGMITDKEGSPIPGVTVIVRGEQKGGVSDGQGRFKIERVPPKSTLVVNSIGFLSRQYRLDGERKVHFVLEPAVSQIDPVEVTGNTGYQVLKKKQTPGAVSVIDSALLNRPVSSNILDRIEGVTSGLLAFRTSGMVNYVSRMPYGADMGLYLRGFSTLTPNSVNPNPLFILDNFPYEGDLRNINPNDIENITVLKDAAASSIWGARSGNGVVVLTTKSGKYKDKMKIDFNMNFSIAAKPDLTYDRNFIESKDYIELERSLFNQGFFDQDIYNNIDRPPVSPVVDLLQRQRLGEISLDGLESELDLLKQNDVRRDFAKYSYRNAVSEQYSIGVRGGTKDFAYYLSLGHDKNRSSLVRNGRNRTTVISSNVFQPAKNLEVSAYMNFTQQRIQESNSVYYRGVQSRSGKFTELYPYARFVDNQGNKVPIVKDINSTYADSMKNLGFLDWKYYPLDEINSTSNLISQQNLILRTSIKYKFLKYFGVELLYQNQRHIVENNVYFDASSYYARDLINTYSIYNPINNNVTNHLPVGGIMMIGDYDWKSNNLRSTINFRRKYSSHDFSVLTGIEIRELSAEGNFRSAVGYDDINGFPITSLNTTAVFPTSPTGNMSLSDKIDFNGFPESLLNRYISYFSVFDYNYKQKYELSLVARKDGANMFGAKANNKVVPFWSIGAGWSIDKESFFNVSFIDKLKLRISSGTNGNVYNGSAYLTIRRNVDPDPLTGLPSSSISNPPNEGLRWEKSNMFNIGTDATLFGNRLNFSFDFFVKKGSEMLQRVRLAPQTGYLNAMTNSASNVTKGIESTILGSAKIGAVEWRPRATFTWVTDKLLKYEQAPTRQTIILMQPNFELLRVQGRSMKGLFSYKWAGLDPKTGDPQGMLNGQPSKNYNGILNNIHTDSLVYHGSATPTIFGVLINDFTYKGFSVSFNISYKLNYYFRKAGLPLNYQDILKVMHQDYTNSWKKPGDEKVTSVPSISSTYNDLRNQFYQRSEVLVERGDHIRLQDIRLAYGIQNFRVGQKLFFRHVEFYSLLNNIGILWRANRLGLDPDVNHGTLIDAYPMPFSASCGVMIKL